MKDATNVSKLDSLLVMFDGSHYPIEENIEKTKELVKVAKGKGMSVEAEVGSIGGEEDGVVGRGECRRS